jgi:hypothetical protein
MSEETESLGTALPKEIARVRDVLIPEYQSIGPAGNFAIMMMRAELDRASTAMISGDVVGMIKSYKALKEFKG